MVIMKMKRMLQYTENNLFSININETCIIYKYFQFVIKWKKWILVVILYARL